LVKPETGAATPDIPANGSNIDDVNKTSKKTYKNITSKKQKNDESICPFLCPHCNTLGPEYLKSRYEPICVISDSLDIIYNPMTERYYDEQKGSVRETRKFFLPTIMGFEQ
jgi:hypothetical protein